MTAEELTGKAKKAKRAEERRKGGSTRKRHQETEAVPSAYDDPEDVDVTVDVAAAPESTKSSKKRKTLDDEKPAVIDDLQVASETQPPSKKPRRSKPTTEDESSAAAAKKQRFIVFVGNLPYTITTAGIEQHFAAIKPESVRHRTEPDTGKSKGFAFLEFANYDRLKTCLKQYHHTVIDSGIGGERGKKKINVELTAGGGGTSASRTSKLKEKNGRLEEQRKRRAEALAKEEKRKGDKEKKAGDKERKTGDKERKTGDKGRRVGGKTGGDKDDRPQRPQAQTLQETGIHPARLAQIQAS